MLETDVLTGWCLFLPPVLGLCWALWEAWNISKVKLIGPADQQGKRSLRDRLCIEAPENAQTQLENMKNIAKIIADGADAFLLQEFRYISLYVVTFSIVLAVFVSPLTAFAFAFGSLTSLLCGYIGMKIAVYTNLRTCHESWTELGPGFQVALRGGCVMGFTLVSIGVITIAALILLFRLPALFGDSIYVQRDMFEAIAGYGLGGSSIALFARVGGGIYTKAADIGADLSGKNEYGMSEDDPRNPACIADNVGDNVGDIAGMGADLFGSFAEATCAGLVIAGASIESSDSIHGLVHTWAGLVYPLTLSSTGILSGIITICIVRYAYPIRSFIDVERALKGVLYISTIIETPIILLCSYLFLPAHFTVGTGNSLLVVAWWQVALCVLLGLWSGLIIGLITEYYTSHSYGPVREIAESQKTSAATGIIYGLALGYRSTLVPVACLTVTVCVAQSLAGMYGISVAALGMLSTLTMGLTADAYGPISDNAGGIAEMAGLGPDVRSRTDALDAAGNTTAAVGKGYAIGSAALVSLALFGAYTCRANIRIVDILDPWVFTGLLVGSKLPYVFSGMTMKSVGVAANDMVQECLRQFPLIMQGSMEPQYNKCIAISTKASLHETAAPGALVILSPIIAGIVFGKNCTAGLLAGALVSGIQLAISASNSGSAWDNSKKYIESGALGLDHAKGSQTHKNAVTGDTVGDPMKDTSGPSLNILIKLSAITSLVFGTLIAEKFSNSKGGPIWI